jgi:hypothetical protein
VIDRLESHVGRELERLGSGGGVADVLTAWPEVVGEAVARHAWPSRLSRDGTLHVATDSSTWSFELTQLAPAILEQLRARLGDAAPAALRFAPGLLPEPSVERVAAATAAREPGAREWSLADEVVCTLDNDELRPLLRRAVAFSLTKAR